MALRGYSHSKQPKKRSQAVVKSLESLPKSFGVMFPHIDSTLSMSASDTLVLEKKGL